MSRLDKIVSLRRDFEKSYQKYLSDSSKFHELKKIVIEIEKEQKLYDVESGFSDAQIKIHDFYIRIPSEIDRKGTVDNHNASELLSTTEEILETIQPNHNSSIGYSLVGLGQGSTVFLYDIVEKKDGIKFYTKEKVKNTLKEVFIKVPELKEKGFNKKKINEFKKTTGLKEKEIYQITQSILKLTPKEIGEDQKIEFGINDDNIQTKFDSNNSDIIQLTKTKKNLYEIVKPKEIIEVEGQLGIMEEWDINHKIVIIDHDQQKHTINYSPTNENKKIIKENIGYKVKIKREKDASDRRKWLLVEWLETEKRT